jgi:hypothetical protein
VKFFERLHINCNYETTNERETISLIMQGCIYCSYHLLLPTLWGGGGGGGGGGGFGRRK